MLPFPPFLREEAKNEVYLFIDKSLKPLPKNPDGTINELTEGFHNNDVDSLRHAYVSGVFTIAYGEKVADFFGRLNEYFPTSGGSYPGEENERNMDLWNNAIGRKYGKKSTTRDELFKYLLKALKNGEMILDPNDPRKYDGKPIIKRKIKGRVIVVEESDKGENITFYDLDKKKLLSLTDFISSIKIGDYPKYGLRNIDGKEIPVSKRDGFNFNNLG